MRRISRGKACAFTLIEMLVVVGIIGLLVAILVPSLAKARSSARSVACLSNMRQIGIATRMYLDEHRGGYFHHHEGWVLDDGTQVDDLPADASACSGGGLGNSHAEKPWVIFLQPYLRSREAGFCPADMTPRSQRLTTTLQDYNGAIESTDEDPPPDSELAIAEEQHLTLVSYLLNSVFSHRSCRYALEGALHGFLTDPISLTIKNHNIIVYSERNSEAMNDAANKAYGSVGQDDYDTWVGEAALVRWGDEAGPFGDQGWIRYNRHRGAANDVYLDGHAERQRRPNARRDQYPDLLVRQPLADPPQ